MKTPEQFLIESDCYTPAHGKNLVGRFLSTDLSRYEQAMERYAEQFKPKWISVADQLPPVDVKVLMRAVISWKSDFRISYFSDIMQVDYEILEYGISGYLLKLNNDYLVVSHPNPEIVCDEYITHWMPLIEPDI